jgi:hypothetical protein
MGDWKLNQELKKKRGNPAWVKGVSANPAGRPLGSRHAISTGVLTEFSALVNSDEAATSLRTLMIEDAGRFWTIAASLLPREVAMTVQQRLPGNLSADQWQRLTGLLAIAEAAGAKGTPEEVAARIERALHAEFAAPPEPLAIEHKPALPPPPYGQAETSSASVT